MTLTDNENRVLFCNWLILKIWYLSQADAPSSRRFTFVNLLLSNLCHLFMFTYSCDCMLHESTKVASAAFAGPWAHLSMNKFGRMIRKDLQLVIMRATRPCTLTANGFFVISLETYTKVFSINALINFMHSFRYYNTSMKEYSYFFYPRL